jgi:hypothetical protein
LHKTPQIKVNIPSNTVFESIGLVVPFFFQKKKQKALVLLRRRFGDPDLGEADPGGLLTPPETQSSRRALLFPEKEAKSG